jgi:uncharacterized membrane protein
MKTENVDLMRQAREALKGKWGLAIGTFVVYFLIISVLQGPSLFFSSTSLLALPTGILTLLISGPLVVGIALFSLSISRNQDASIGQLFLGFNKYGICLAAYLLVALFTILWMLLLIIPGIIAAISYSMTFYIIADEDSIGAMEAIDKSKKMMDGYKWKYFCLLLRFFGWALLCILTLGIGFLWLVPYIQVSLAKFYDDVKSLLAAKENAPSV